MVPVEVRKIIVESRAKGIPAEEIRKVTGVSLSAINNIVSNYKKRGTLEGNYPGRQPKITKEQRKAMIKLVKEKPDITINEIIEELNLPIKKSRVSKILLEEKMYLKKKQIRAAERKDKRVKKQRKKWKKFQKKVKKSRLIFLDESGVNVNMTRFYGRAKGKKRVYDYVPAKRIKRTTLLSSVRLDGTIVKKVFQGALNGKIFLDYIKNTLVPTLHKGDIVVMDNLSCHKVKGVKEAIESVKASVLYLPPYSPDFNPIEMMWSKIKSLLRKWKARTSDMLDFFLIKAFSSVTTENIQHWFSECGYR